MCTGLQARHGAAEGLEPPARLESVCAVGSPLPPGSWPGLGQAVKGLLRTERTEVDMEGLGYGQVQRKVWQNWEISEARGSLGTWWNWGR